MGLTQCPKCGAWVGRKTSVGKLVGNASVCCNGGGGAGCMCVNRLMWELYGGVEIMLQ